MLYVTFFNTDVNLKYVVPIEEVMLQELLRTGVPETINPAVETWLMEWDEAREVMESIANLTQTQPKDVVHQFLRLVETFERKGAVIVNNKYKSPEDFLKVFKKYVKQFNVPKSSRAFPPDMAITTLACLIAIKSQHLELELPTECFKYYLNIIEAPAEPGPAIPGDVPPSGVYSIPEGMPNPAEVIE